MLNSILKIGGIIVGAVVLVAGGVVLGSYVAARVVPQPAAVAGPNVGVVPPSTRGFNAPQPGAPFGMMPGYRFPYRDDGGRRPNGVYPNQPGYMMRGGFVPDPSLVPAQGQKLTLDNAVKVAQAYLTAYNDSNLKLAEVTQFENNFYALVVEKDTNRGAFEFLIDPSSASVFPEPGPNMMWNLKYGMMGRYGNGMMGGGFNYGNGDQMPIDAAKAQTLAQAEVDRVQSGATVEKDGTAFYGYYTFDYQVGGKIAGMLSVNGYSGAVWLHTWHGAFVDEKQLQ